MERRTSRIVGDVFNHYSNPGPPRAPGQNTIAGPHVCLQKKKVITSAYVLLSTQNSVKSKKRSSSCNGALSGQTGRAPQNMTGPGIMYSPPPSQRYCSNQLVTFVLSVVLFSHGVGRVVGALGSGAGFVSSMRN